MVLRMSINIALIYDCGAIDDRLGIEAVGKRAEAFAPVAVETGCTERIGHRRCRETHERRGPKRKRHHLDDTSYRAFEVFDFVLTGTSFSFIVASRNVQRAS